MENLLKVNHENIIECLAYNKKESLLIIEYAEDGSLNQLLHSPRYANVDYNLAHAIDWGLQIAKGVQYLHSLKPKLIIHRDLKPHNILLKDNFRKIKICDFGTACSLKTLMTTRQGSLAYMSPEVMKCPKYNEKCDIFSFGVTWWEILQRQIPYSTNQIEKPDTNDDNDETNSSTNCTTYVGYSPYAIFFR